MFLLQNRHSYSSVLKLTPVHGFNFFCQIALITLGSICVGKYTISFSQDLLTPQSSYSKLWQAYRWSIDPARRREAALLLVSKSKDSPNRNLRILEGQGWGEDPLSGFVLKFQAQIYARLGQSKKSNNAWRNLLDRFPMSPSAADAYYFLGRKNKQLRQQLFQRHPAHPAALASAIESVIDRKSLHQSAVHLARWGVRWPGAAKLLREACLLPVENLNDRNVIAYGLALLGDGSAALECSNKIPRSSSTSLAIGQAILQGDPEIMDKGEALLFQVAKENSNSFQGLEALKLLSTKANPNISLLQNLPEALLKKSPYFQAARIRLKPDSDNKIFFSLWPEHPESWELQWDLAREALLEGSWSKARSILEMISTENLPSPIASRKEFWMGFIAEKLQRPFLAKQIWKKLIQLYPDGYYTWRAKVRLELDDLPQLIDNNLLTSRPGAPQFWEQLNSQELLVNKLWRLGFPNDAWETWRSSRVKPLPQKDISEEILVEGRLRMAVGDDWMGLAKLNQLSLRFVGGSCYTRQLLHRSQFPYRFWPEIQIASSKSGVRPELLLAISKQESRFSPGVKSIVGAIGLMQLMPETASDLSDAPVTNNSLADPSINILLGSRYLVSLLKRWNSNPWLAIASYNAGPTVVSDWNSPELELEPELWVERIPYPETRFFTKKVLGNFWSYLNLQRNICKL